MEAHFLEPKFIIFEPKDAIKMQWQAFCYLHRIFEQKLSYYFILLIGSLAKRWILYEKWK